MLWPECLRSFTAYWNGRGRPITEVLYDAVFLSKAVCWLCDCCETCATNALNDLHHPLWCFSVICRAVAMQNVMQPVRIDSAVHCCLVAHSCLVLVVSKEVVELPDGMMCPCEDVIDGDPQLFDATELLHTLLRCRWQCGLLSAT